MTAAILTTLPLALACAACAAPVEGDATRTARVIVRFKPGTPDPVDPTFRAGLARAARVARIDLIRPMSGDAYVLQVACTAVDGDGAGDPCAAATDRLGRTDAVLFAEPDRREKIK